MALILYTRRDCHLCDQALEVIGDSGLEVSTRDIDTDLELLHLYRDRIPVLQRSDTGEELGWPFDSAAVRELASGR